jgi:heptosyltransferase-2
MKRQSSQTKLAVRLPNWIGDALMAHPLLEALAEAKVDFTCFGKDWVSQIFSGTDFQFVADARVENKLWLKSQYQRGGFTHVILCPNSFSAILPAALAQVKTTGYHFLCSDRVVFKGGVHRVENYFDLGRSFFGAEWKVEERSQFIPIDATRVHQANEILDNFKESRFTVVCPYATNLHKGRNKEWPFWKELLQKLSKNKIIALVAPEDEIRCKEDFPTATVLSVPLALAAIIMKRADAVITNDSGAMHLASFFGANVVGLFGVTDVYETRPWFGNYIMGEGGSWSTLDCLLDYLDMEFGIASE